MNQRTKIKHYSKEALLSHQSSKPIYTYFFWFGFSCFPLFPWFWSYCLFVPGVPLLGFEIFAALSLGFIGAAFPALPPWLLPENTKDTIVTACKAKKVRWILRIPIFFVKHLEKKENPCAEAEEEAMTVIATRKNNIICIFWKMQCRVLNFLLLVLRK